MNNINGNDYFDVICIQEYTTLKNDGTLYTIKEGTIYTISKFQDVYKIKGENSFIMTEQYSDYFIPLQVYRQNQIDDILE